MKIAYTMGSGRGDTDLLLASLAARLGEYGLRTCGVVQINTECGDNQPCDMDVKVLPIGPVIRISQSLGKGSRGCRLDPAALEQAVADAMARIEEGADVLIVNKFGKHEADGRGFRNVIAEALARDIPVIVGLNQMNEPAFLDFSGGLAALLPPALDALSDWVRDATTGAAVAG